MAKYILPKKTEVFKMEKKKKKEILKAHICFTHISFNFDQNWNRNTDTFLLVKKQIAYKYTYDAFKHQKNAM